MSSTAVQVGQNQKTQKNMFIISTFWKSAEKCLSPGQFCDIVMWRLDLQFLDQKKQIEGW